MKLKYLLIIVLFVIIGTAFHQTVYAGISSISSQQCTVTTEAGIAVGNQVSVTILAANSRRAWARIALNFNTAGIATSTPWLSFNGGAAAVVGSGTALATTSPTMLFGLNEGFAYTGAVTGITGIATTSVQVTQCVY